MAIPRTPDGCRIEFEDLPDRLTIRIPPPGITRSGGRMFWLALVWCSFMAGLTTVWADQGGRPIQWGALVAIVPLWLIGIGLLLYAIKMARQQAAIVMSGGRVMAVQSSIIGSKRGEWDLDEIRHIYKSDGRVAAGKDSVYQLVIESKDGRRFGMLDGRREVELRWLAKVLSGRLNLAPASDPEVSMDMPTEEARQ